MALLIEVFHELHYRTSLGNTMPTSGWSSIPLPYMDNCRIRQCSNIRKEKDKAGEHSLLRCYKVPFPYVDISKKMRVYKHLEWTIEKAEECTLSCYKIATIQNITDKTEENHLAIVGACPLLLWRGIVEWTNIVLTNNSLFCDPLHSCCINKASTWGACMKYIGQWPQRKMNIIAYHLTSC